MFLKKKKANTILIVSIIGFIVLIGVGLLIYGLLKKNGNSEKEQELNYIPFFVEMRDVETEQPVSGNYILEYQNSENERVEVSKGQLISGWSELSVPTNYRILMTCWNANHYLVKAYKQFSKLEIADGNASFVCDMVEIGNLTISNKEELKDKPKKINLNITSNGWFYKTGLCIAWTSGFLDVTPENQFITCEAGNWKNTTAITNATSKYLCGEDYIMECESVFGNKCKEKNTNIPERFKNQVDSCFTLGRSLHNESLVVPLNVNYNYFQNSLDHIDIYIFDMERRFSSKVNEYEWISELNNQDIGAEDIKYTLRYSP